MTLSKSVATILSNKTAAAAGATTLTDCTTIDTQSMVSLAIEVKATYGSSATLAGTLKIFASSDDSTYDTDPVDSLTMPYTANATKSQTFNIVPGARYLKVQVINNESAGANKDITAIYVYSHPHILS